jgi:hypothetical protein
MDYFAGLDVSVKDTSGCIVDSAGKIVREVKVASEARIASSVWRCPCRGFRAGVTVSRRPVLTRSLTAKQSTWDVVSAAKK